MENSFGTPVNIYTNPAFLDVIAQVYFPATTCQVQEFNLDGDVYRLLAVQGREPLIAQTFLDLHEPLAQPAAGVRRERLRRLPEASLGFVDLDEFRADPKWANFNGAPTVRWEGFKSWEAYLELLRKRRVLTDDQRRNRRLQEALGPLEFQVDDLGEDVLPTGFAWKSMRDQAAERTDLFAREENRKFFYVMRERGLLRASTLRAGGQLLAVWLGAAFQGRWTGWVFTFNPDPALSKYSLGRQLLYPMLEESYRSGHQEFDFSIGLEPYKYYFATHVRAIGPRGKPPIAQQLKQLAKAAIKRNPWLYERVKALRGRQDPQS